MAAKDQDSPKVDTELESRAFGIYCAMASENRMRFKTPQAMAQESFQLAKAFGETLKGVRDGSISIEAVEPPKPKLVKIQRMHAKSESTPAIFEPTLDPKTRKPIFDEILQDFGAFCPNAPLNHPANARFAPLDGRTAEEHINEARAQLALN